MQLMRPPSLWSQRIAFQSRRVHQFGDCNVSCHGGRGKHSREERLRGEFEGSLLNEGSQLDSIDLGAADINLDDLEVDVSLVTDLDIYKAIDLVLGGGMENNIYLCIDMEDFDEMMEATDHDMDNDEVTATPLSTLLANPAAKGATALTEYRILNSWKKC